MSTLAELLRLKEAENPQERAFIGYPQISNRPRQEGAVSGFLAGASGLPAKENLSVLNPQDVAYMQGQNYGELASAGIALTGIPALLRAIPKTAAKAAPKLDQYGQALENLRVNDYPSLVKKYNLLQEAEGGKVLNTDLARELSDAYTKNRTLSASVHEPSSAFVKQRFAEKLAEPAPEGSRVLFTAGGTGAGKTSSLAAYPDLRNSAEMIYDTNMNKLESARKKIDQALDAGRQIDLVYTYRDPVEALVEGSLTRAMRMKKDLGSGRTVPLKEHIKTHTGSREVIGQLKEIYGDNPNVRIGIIDNRYGKANPKVANLEDLPVLDPKKIEKDLRNALEEQYKLGKVDKDIYESSK
jgi:hypothetical protein